MARFIKWFLIIVAVLAVIGYFAFQRMKVQTKQASPEEKAELRMNGVEIDVTYNRPSKRGRDIFGALVPYRQVWRTGANEATTFTTNTDLRIGGNPLPAGSYTLWTIPRQEDWTIIFNEKQYPWGVRFDGSPSHDPQADALTVEAPVQMLNDTVELFTIRFQRDPPTQLILEWDLVRVAVPVEW